MPPCSSIKHGMVSGYAGVGSEPFFKNTRPMLFADAETMVEDIDRAMAQ